MEFNKLAFNGAEINFGIKGDIKKRPVIFIHGNSLSSATFRNQSEKLVMPVITIDLPGHGRSEPPIDPISTYSLPGYTEVINSFLNQLNIQDFILVGHSLGGHIATNVAAHSKDLKGLLLFGTPPLDSVASFGSAFLPNPLMPLLFQDVFTSEQALQLAESMLSQQQYKSDLQKDIMATDGAARSSFGAFVGKGIIEDEVKIIRSHKFPVAILHGEHDSYINKEYIDKIGFSNLWKNKVHQINNSGHCPQIEQPEVFNALLSDYYHTIFS